MTDQLIPIRMANEDNTLVLLLDKDAVSANLIIKGFAKTELPHQMHHLSSCSAVINYLRQAQDNAGSDKFAKPRLIVFNVDILDDDCKNILIFLKSDKILKRIPVLLFSSRDDNQSIESAFENKVNSYLIKPSDPHEFSKVVFEVACYWLKWNQLSP